jgi:hypothetical protein
MASIINAGTTTLTPIQITGDTSGILQLQTNGGTTAVTIDTAQNVGVGVTPSAWESGAKVIQFSTATPGGTSGNTGSIWARADTIRIINAAYYNGTNYIYSATGVSPSFYFQQQGAHLFYVNSTTGTAGTTASGFNQAMTLDNSGNLYLGTTSQIGTSQLSVVGVGVKNGITVQVSSSSYQNYQGNNASGTTSFYVESGGAIHSTSTSIVAISDQTLKTNIKPLETGLAEINKLQPRRFDWIVDSGMTEKNVAGFISQEVEPILPDLVSPWKQTDEITLLGLKMGDMIPTMVKAIQELSAQVTALQTEVAQLQGAK